VAGAILVSPFLAVAMPVPAWKRLLARVIGEILPALPFATGLDAAHLSTDPAVGQAAKSDPLYHRVMTPRAFREVRAAQAAVLAEGDGIAVPTLFLLAGDDRIVSRPTSEAFARGLKGDVTVRVYDGFYHEVLNEPHRARAYRDVEPWLDRILRAAGGSRTATT
jgi:alpha-beta hydrolase superfamily lysophospholipase